MSTEDSYASDEIWPLRARIALYREGWPHIVNDARQQGLVGGGRHLVSAVSITVADFAWHVIAGLYKSAKAAKASYDMRYRNYLLTRSMANPRLRPGHGAVAAESLRDYGPLFSKLPPEIRRHILMLAFGNYTVHMDLSFRHPFHEVDPADEWRTAGSGSHSWVHAKIAYDEDKLDTSKPEAWRWLGCICHRLPAAGVWLPLGRRRNYPWTHFAEPDLDHCLHGGGHCKAWPGELPGKCFLGVHGWLLSCRQAYLEGIDVLYATNTIHISSPVLVRGIQDIFSPHILSMMRSIELVWNTNEVPLAEGFTGLSVFNPATQSGRDPLFPGLVYLHISFKCLVYDMRDNATGLVWPYKTKKLLAQRLHEFTYPTIDRVLERIVPPTTDVTISCPKWDWYEQTDLRLVELQGEERTRMQRAETDGLKCWRVTPPSPGDDSGQGAAADSPKTRPSREGYWIHIKSDEVKLDDYGSDGYNWRRHNLHNLGPEQYRIGVYP